MKVQQSGKPHLHNAHDYAAYDWIAQLCQCKDLRHTPNVCHRHSSDNWCTHISAGPNACTAADLLAASPKMLGAGLVPFAKRSAHMLQLRHVTMLQQRAETAASIALLARQGAPQRPMSSTLPAVCQGRQRHAGFTSEE